MKRWNKGRGGWERGRRGRWEKRRMGEREERRKGGRKGSGERERGKPEWEKIAAEVERQANHTTTRQPSVKYVYLPSQQHLQDCFILVNEAENLGSRPDL